MRFRVLAILGATVVLVIAIARGFLPMWIENQLVAAGRGAGVEVSIDDLTLSVLSGTITADGVSISDPRLGDEPVLRAARASVDLEWAPLLDRRIHLERVAIVNGRWLGRVEEQGIRLPGDLGGDPADPAAEGQETAEANPVETAWPFRVDLASIDSLALELTLEDGRTVEALLDLRVEALVRGAPAPIAASLVIAGGRVDLEGNLTADPPAIEGALRLRGIGIPELAGFALPALSPWWSGGTLDADLTLEGGMLSETIVSGELRGRDIGLRAPSGNGSSVTVPSVTIDLDKVAVSEARNARLGTIAIAAPQASLRIPDPEWDAFVASLVPADGGTAGDLRIEAIRVTDGSLALHAPETEEREPFDLALSNLEIETGAFIGASNRLETVSVTALVEGAPLHVEGERVGGDSGALTGLLDQIALAPFEPLIAMAGFELRRGRASLDTSVDWSGDETTLRNEVTLNDLELDSVGERFQESYGLPLDTALALMTDLDGALHLTVPVVIDASGSSIGLGGVLRGALRDAILGAIASPLKIVGGVASIFSDDAPASDLASSEVAMLRGEALPNEAGLARLEAWAELLAGRPRLAVEIRGLAHADEARDPAGRRALAERRAAAVREQLAGVAGLDERRVVVGEAELPQAARTNPPDVAAASPGPRAGARLRLRAVR